MNLTRAKRLGLALLILLAVPPLARGQENLKATRLHGSTTLRGAIGGESLDRYVIRARKGQRLTVRITWRQEGENFAGFTISDLATDERVTFGKEFAGGKRWTGRIPKTGDYEIQVWAHPIASYTLRVILK